MGFAGPDCSLVVPVTTQSPTDLVPVTEQTIKMEKKEVPYGKPIRV